MSPRVSLDPAVFRSRVALPWMDVPQLIILLQLDLGSLVVLAVASVADVPVLVRVSWSTGCDS